MLPREDTPGTKQLVAYVVVNGPGPGLKELREHLKKQVPDYMLPSAFVFMDRFPLTNNGKIDRKALPAPEQERPDLGAIFVAPRTPVEEMLAVIWAEVLRLERVGVQDNFFELGGDSLSAVQVVSRVNQSTNVGLALSMLFEHPTVEGLADAIAERQISGADPGELASLLAELDKLSEAEALEQLSLGRAARASSDLPEADRGN